MKTHLVSFSTPQYRPSQKGLEASAIQFGIDEIHSFTENDLERTDFRKNNMAIFQHSKGYGYWLWKPFFILEVMKKAKQGDIIMYADAGNTVIADLKPLFKLCLIQNIVLFQVHTHKNTTWTKRDTFVLMDCDEAYYQEAEQVCGSPQLYKVCQESFNFVEKWFDYCKNPHLLTDLDNICGLVNHPEFKEHRHDQSILSLLALKEGIKIHRDPSQYGNPFINDYADSNYDQLLDLHRNIKLSLVNQNIHKFRTFISKLRYLLPLRHRIKWLDILALCQSDNSKLNVPTLMTITLQKPTKRHVFIRKSSKIDKIVLKYVFFNQYHQPPIPLSKECIILDLGANIGLTMVDFKQNYPQSKVLGFEMDTQNYLLAQKNIEGLADCRIENIAVWHTSKIVQYATNVDEDAYHISENARNTEGAMFISVEALSLDDILNKYDLKTVDYVKMDIEGAEKAILRNGKRAWLRRVNCLNVEIHDPQFLEEAIHILENFGFKCQKDTNHWSAILAVRVPQIL